MLYKGRKRLFGDDWRIVVVIGHDPAGEFEVVERLLAGHTGGACADELRFWWGLKLSNLAPGVELGAAFGCGYALNLVSMGEFLFVGGKPPFAIS